VERIYWWQLVAPGYGLIDSREKVWRKRAGFFALKTITSQLKESVFLHKVPHPQAEIFAFLKGEDKFAVCWTKDEAYEHLFERKVTRVVSRDGKEISTDDSRVRIDVSPKYVFFG